MMQPPDTAGSTAAATTYSVGQYAENYPPGIERYFWNVARNAVIARALRRAHMARLPLLEIGSGRGIVVEYLRRRGMDCIGCELAPAPVPDHLRAVIFENTDFADLPATQRGGIRGALLCDVIEHLPDPAALLRDVRRALPALERVLVTVPARPELWSDWDRHFGHFQRYDLGTLRATLEAAGFRPLFAGYFFHGLYIPAFLLRGRRRTALKAPSLPWLHAMVGAAFRFEAALVPGTVPGTSAIITAAIG